MELRKHITIRQVAEASGVSIQTVSRVINNRYDVAAETRQRVQDAIVKLGYKPNAIARGLASRHTRTLGVIANTFDDFFVNALLDGAERESHKQGYFIMLGNTSSAGGNEPNYVRLIAERHIEGILFLGAGTKRDEEYLINFHHSGIPLVASGFHKEKVEDFIYVDVNNQEGGRKATHHLIEQGHTQIAVITGPDEYNSARDRTQGYLQALEEAHITPNRKLIIPGSWRHKGGYDGMRQLLSQNIPFTAVFVHNDRSAIGALSMLHQAGLRVPEDVSIIGYDDETQAEFTDPPLTTIHQPMDEMAATATRLLIQLVEGARLDVEPILFDTELVVRKSVCPPNENRR